MNGDAKGLIEGLDRGERLTAEEFRRLLEGSDEESDALLREKAVARRKAVYGNAVFVRGLIEISSYCKNDCLYCGIRRSNRNADRYRLTEEQILTCADEGYALGFRTFVLQGGEDAYFTDERLVPLLLELKRRHPDCAVTLSVGERTLPAASRDGHQSPLRNAAPAGNVLRQAHGVPAGPAGHRLRGGCGLHGGQPGADGGTPCK